MYMERVLVTGRDSSSVLHSCTGTRVSSLTFDSDSDLGGDEK